MNKKPKSIKAMVIKLCIGLILLFFSLQYLHRHPAERDAIMSGFDIMWGKISHLWIS